MEVSIYQNTTLFFCEKSKKTVQVSELHLLQKMKIKYQKLVFFFVCGWMQFSSFTLFNRFSFKHLTNNKSSEGKKNASFRAFSVDIFIEQHPENACFPSQIVRSS